jgi:hypothetical protein
VLTSLLGQKLNFACILPGKTCNHQSKVLHNTSGQTVAAIGLQTSRQAFKRNLISSRQWSWPYSGHYVLEIGRSSIQSLDYDLFPNIRITSREISFKHGGGHISWIPVVFSTAKHTFLGCIIEITTTKS